MNKFTALLFLSLIWRMASAQVSFDNYAITGVTIIDANHQVPVPRQTILITNHIISKIFNDGSKSIPDSFVIMKMDGKYLLPAILRILFLNKKIVAVRSLQLRTINLFLLPETIS